MKRKGHRRKGILWDYNLDGISSRERIKGFWKQYWRRWLKRKAELLLRAEGWKA